MAFNVDEYKDVAERITEFYAKHPAGRLTRLGEPKVMEVGSKLFVMYTAKAYRTPDDPVPAIGTAWEPFPGPTQFTRDSELMNAETAAWGRAIVAVGIGTKKIASKEEVRARTDPKVAEAPAEAPKPTIPEDHARLLVDAAKAAGVDAGILQRAVSVCAERDVGPCDTKAKAVAAVGSLTERQAKNLEQWISAKAKEGANA